MEIERECLSHMKEENALFFLAAQKYRVEITKTKAVTKNTDNILSYYLLSLLSNGETKRFCLVRASIESLMDIEDLPQVRLLDVFWRASLLGDLPQMKISIENLSKAHQKIGNKAVDQISVCQTESSKDHSMHREKGSIERVIQMSKLFFQV